MILKDLLRGVPVLTVEGDEAAEILGLAYSSKDVRPGFLFAALKGFGATVRFVYLPYESHGYSARESVLTVLAEMFEWFDRYVKNRK